MYKSYIFAVLCLTPFLSFAQTSLTGTVQDEEGSPIFAANVYVKSTPQKGVVTDFSGNFSLALRNLEDTLVISFISYETQEISLKTLNFNEEIVVVLAEKSHSLQEVILKPKHPISEPFAITKMDILEDVYLNPTAQGDPLKAIANLPSSTTIDETANPSLRGSSADRSRVVLNGVPIYKPVRASNIINNQGFFSLFNPEIIEKQYVYASNPPLTFGNTSAGLVEIQTKQNLEANQLQFSAGLLNTGFFLSQKIKKDISFIQVYGNYQFSDAFTGIQEDKLPNIKNFYATDAGINFHSKVGKRGEFNSFSYFIDESFSGVNQLFTYKGDVATSKKRLFTVNNFKYYFQESVLSINSGINNSTENYEFGNLDSEQNTRQVYTSIDYKWHILETTNLQFGVSHDYHQNKFKDSVPTFYYALSPTSPGYFSKTNIDNHILETYLYTIWDINDKFTFSSGMRSNLPLGSQEYYFSSQLGLKYHVNKKQWFLISGGKYRSYSIPNFNIKHYNLLKSYQAAVDYTHESENTLLKAAAYFKNEKGKQMSNNFFNTGKINTFGLELSIVHAFSKHLKVSFSNSFINQKITVSEKNYPGANDFDYLIRASVQYANPKLFTLALTYTGRPGTFYNNITGSIFDTQNQKEALYNRDYSSKSFDFYQRRNIYFGTVWQLGY